MPETNILRRIWQLVDISNPYTLIELSDEEIVDSLIEQVKNILPLSLDDTNTLSKYVQARTPLIRDLALSKLV